MAINAATKYAEKVAERFTGKSKTEGHFNNDYDWSGVKTIQVYSVDAPTLNNYQRTGSNRYGTPNELGDTLQELSVTQDKSFTYTIDKGNDEDTKKIKSRAGKRLQRTIDEVIVPAVDKYRFTKWAEGAGHAETGAAPTRDTIVDLIFDAGAHLDNQLVPAEGRVLYIKASSYKVLAKCDEFLQLEKPGTKAIVKGEVGEIDGMKVIKVPDSWMPDDVYFMVIHKSAVLSPFKLQEYKTHENPPGINGWLVEGRIYYDAFVLDAKQDAVYTYGADAD